MLILKIDTLSNFYKIAYSSPELLSLLPYNPLVNDLWSLGFMLYELLYARLPFGQRNYREIFKKQKNGVNFLTSRNDEREMPSAKFKDLVVGMLQFNIEERFVMRDMMLHYWTAYEFAPLRDAASRAQRQLLSTAVSRAHSAALPTEHRAMQQIEPRPQPAPHTSAAVLHGKLCINA